MSADRRPLWQPFSDTAADEPVAAGGRARPAPVGRAPFPEPRIEDALPAVPKARRPLGDDHLAGTGLPGDRA